MVIMAEGIKKPFDPGPKGTIFTDQNLLYGALVQVILENKLFVFNDIKGSGIV